MKRILAIIGLLTAFVTGATAQIPADSNCPKISISGPQFVTNLGDVIKVSAKLAPEFPGVHFVWSVSHGQIATGQGTSSITIATDALGKSTYFLISVNLGVTGLPEGCNASASDKFPVTSVNFDAFPVDEYEGGWSDRERAGLDNLGIRISANEADQKAYIVLEFENGTSQSVIKRRVANIKKYLFVKRKYPKDRFVILGKQSPAPRTTFWIWPSASTFPMCEGCRVY